VSSSREPNAPHSEYRRFVVVLRELLIERGITTKLGNPHWMALTAAIEDVSYETLRKALVGERNPSAKILERVAEQLDVTPETFAEYRLSQVQQLFDPRAVGIDAALASLAVWERQPPASAAEEQRTD
jgi:transcriptional regulator with XRE-family HTH domain